MAQSADRRSDRSFAIGDYVYLKLKPYKQSSIRKQTHHKLLPKYYGPYKVLDIVGKVAYQLGLPAESKIHNVFHVSQLKLCKDPTTVLHVPIPNEYLSTVQHKIPEAILERKMVKRGRVAATKVLIKWQGLPPDQATWEFYYDFLQKYPDFHP